MKALLLGGTGPIGIEVANQLCLNGWEVAVTSRSPQEGNQSFSIRQGNALDPSFFSSLLDENWDAIVDFMIYSTEQFKGRYQRLLACCEQYIFLSSARVYACSDEPLTEDSPRILDVCTDDAYLATEEYALSKARQEDLLLGCKNEGWTIVRPYITYGRGRFQLGIWEKEEWLYRALKRRAIVVSSEINSCLTTLTDSRDVGSGIAALAGNGQARGQIFQITGTKPICWGDAMDIYLEAISRSIGARPETHAVEAATFEHLAGRTHQLHYDRLLNRTFDSSKIHRFANLSRFRSPEVGIPFYVERFLAKPDFASINWLGEALKDTVTNELAALAEFQNLKSLISYYAIRYLRPVKRRLFCPKSI